MADPREVIQIDSDSDEDEDLRRAIALSLQDQQDIEGHERPECSKQQPFPEAVPAPSPDQQGVQFGSLSLNRKAMEEERLRRTGKRPRSSSDDVEARPARRAAPPSISAHDGKKPVEGYGSGSQVAEPSLPFPNGTVKRTWAKGYDRKGDDITIEEVLQKEKLKLAIVSSFQWDEEWLLSKIDIARTNVLLVAFAKDETQQVAMEANGPPNVKFCFPPMHGFGAMHSKLQILKFEGYIRIVIPTGNFVPYDWGEDGIMENVSNSSQMVFLIDLPRLEEGSQTRPETSFQTELKYFLEALGVGDRMIASLSRYDFSKTANYAFVHSIPGSHKDESFSRVGYRGLGTSVAALGLASSAPIEVDLACASLGALNHGFIKAFYDACRGHATTDTAQPEPRSGKTPRMTEGRAEVATAQVRERFRIYFPTDRTVSESRGGRQAGGTICMQARWWQSANFPAELMRDVVTTRDRILMHTKVIFVRRPCGGEEGAGRSAGWAYVGSANLSESAWGRLSTTRGQAKLICRNWECGVLIPLPKGDGQPRAMDNDLSMFAGTVPVPMRVPGPEYRPGEEPWFFLGAR